jgi:hypothetical protein
LNMWGGTVNWHSVAVVWFGTLDREGDKTVVVLDVSLQNVGTGAQHTFKSKIKQNCTGNH